MDCTTSAPQCARSATAFPQLGDCFSICVGTYRLVTCDTSDGQCCRRTCTLRAAYHQPDSHADHFKSFISNTPTAGLRCSS